MSDRPSDAPPDRPVEPARQWTEGRWLPVLAGLLGVLVSLLLWRALSADERADVARNAAVEAELLTEELATEMENRVLTLVRMAARWSSPFEREGSGGMKRWEMEAALNFSHYPGYRAVLLLRPDATLRAQIPPDQRVVPDLHAALADDRWRPTLLEARMERAARLTPPLELPSGESVFLAFVPMFRGDRFEGWIGGAFHYGEVVAAALPDLGQEFAVTVTHESVAIHRAGGEPAEDAPTARARLALYGSELGLSVTPTPARVAAVRSRLPMAVLLAGLLVSFLLALTLHFAGRASRRARNLAVEHARLEEVTGQLARSRDFVLAILEKFPNPVWRAGPDRKCDYVNEAWLDFTGRPLEAELGDGWSEGIHPDDREHCLATYGEAFEAREPFVMEYRLRHRSGDYRRIMDHGAPLFDLDGVFAGYIGSCYDVEEQRRMAEELERERARLVDAQSVAGLGSWEWDVDGDRVTWSEELHRIFGLEPDSAPLDFAAVLDRIHPEDRDRIDRLVRKALDDETVVRYEYDYRLVRPDGEIRHIHARARAERDGSGRLVRLFGTSHDVTARMAAERALRESEAHYRLLADHANDMITRYTPEGICTYASPATRELLGHDPDGLVGRHGKELIHPADLPLVVESHRGVLHGEDAAAVMCRLRHRDERWVWFESTSRGVRDPETGRVESIVVVSRDVSENVEQARTVRLLQRVAVAANEAGTVRDAMRAALALVCEYTGWPIGHVYVPARDGPGILTPTDIWHVEGEDRYARFRAVTETTSFAPGEGLPGRVLESGRPAWIEDVAGDPDFPRARLESDLGVRSALAFPVGSGGETVAVLEFFSTDVEAPDEDLLATMETLGVQLAQVVRRQRAESVLKASEARFRALAESASDAIVIADEAGRIVYCNDAVGRIFGRECDDLFGQPVTVLMPERFREPHTRGLERYLETRRPKILGQPVEMAGLHADGHEIPLELSLSSWTVDEGTYFTAILRDITSRKRAERALGEKVEELARSNAELGLFTYVVSHDLREPLRTVASNIQLVHRQLGDEVDEEARASLDYALDGVRRMRAMLDDLLTYSRVGTEGRPLVRIDPSEVVEEVVLDLGAALDESGGTVDVGDLPAVRGDGRQLAQLFQNLLSNAIKFSVDGRPRVDVTAERRDGMIEFAVADNGPGIDPRHAGHVFTIFKRLHDGEVPGTGVGLAICRRIVERHGGRIWVDPEAPRGTVVRFTLPPA